MKANAQALSVKVHALGPDDGSVDVVWENPNLDETRSSLLVSASSITVGQVLQVFHLQAETKTAEGAWNPHGYEPWPIEQGTLQATIASSTAIRN